MLFPSWVLAQSSDVSVSAPVAPHIIDVDLRDLPKPKAWKPGMPIKEVRRSVAPVDNDPVLQRQRDPLLDLQTRGGSTPPPSTLVHNYDGGQFSGVQPPDPVGEVGNDYFIQSINGQDGAIYSIYNKMDGSLAAGPFTMDNLASGFPCNNGAGDPILLFDELADRWMISEFSGSTNTLCVYVSQTPDPIAGGWFSYAFDTASFPDYPKYGIWPDAYYVTSNNLTSPRTPGLHALDRVSMLAGMPASIISTTLPRIVAFGFESATPADLDGSTPPPPGAPGIIIRHRDDELTSPGSAVPDEDYLELFEVSVDFTSPGSIDVAPVINIPIAEIQSEFCGPTFNCIDQPNTGTGLDPLREVVMYRVAYRNMGDHQVLVGNLATDIDDVPASATSGIRWFEARRPSGVLSGGWSVFQEGTHAPDNVNRWMGGIAMDADGNIGLAYNVSDAVDTFPGLRYTGRLASSPAGTMPLGEISLVEGGGANPSVRYGDYASMSVDPVDGCTFWFTGEYNPTSLWSTRIAAFRFDNCGCGSLDAPSSLSVTTDGDNRVAVSWDAVAGAESYEIYRALGSCPEVSFELIATDVSGTEYIDTTVSGGLAYSYEVIAYDGDADCRSLFSSCASVTATGDCILLPDFQGITGVVNPRAEMCSLTIHWDGGTASCGTGVVYNLYRSTSPLFVPGPGNSIATCLTETTYTDTDVESGMTYYYTVRAEDTTGSGDGPCASGIADQNTAILAGIPTGPDMIGFSDDMESGDGAWTLTAGPEDTGTESWILTTEGTGPNGTSWFGSDEPDTKDQRLELAAAFPVTPQSRLSFLHAYDLEEGANDFWDGGVLEYSTDGGTTWFDILEGNGDGVPANDARFLENGYVGMISFFGDGPNPLANRQAFSGDSDGFITTVVDLADFSGESVRFRFRLGCDSSANAVGWWVDDFTIITPDSCVSGFVCDGLNDAVPEWPEITILDLLTCPDFRPAR